jgi:aryl-alcohol dehydrogenase-like predicted oxidoreductase
MPKDRSDARLAARQLRLRQPHLHRAPRRTRRRQRGADRPRRRRRHVQRHRAADREFFAAIRLLRRALGLGHTLFDTAVLSCFGADETLVGEALAHRRREIVLASMCGIFRNVAGVREIDARPDAIGQSVEDSLRRLATKVIDLCYLDRWDKRGPLEDGIGACAELTR